MVVFLKFVIALLLQTCIAYGQSSGSTTKYCDSKTSICYSSWTIDSGVSFRIALPTNSVSSDAIVQIEAPAKIKWVGMAWGGRMTGNPLTVMWPNGNNVVISSRLATAYAAPSAYSGATYTVLKGTGSTGSSWTGTARCIGCTRWTYSGNSNNVDSGSSIRIAWATSSVAVNTPSSNTSTFAMHTDYNYFTEDLSFGKTTQTTYDGWVKSNAQ